MVAPQPQIAMHPPVREVDECVQEAKLQGSLEDDAAQCRGFQEGKLGRRRGQPKAGQIGRAGAVVERSQQRGNGPNLQSICGRFAADLRPICGRFAACSSHVSRRKLMKNLKINIPF